MDKLMKKHFLPALSLAALLLALTLSACGNNSQADNMENSGSLAQNNELPQNSAVAKEDCNSVYAEIIAVNGTNLTVSAGNRTLSLHADSDLLLDWKEGEQVILFYTGEFGDDMQVHYIDKWTQNSEVQKPDSSEKDSQENSGGTVLE